MKAHWGRKVGVVVPVLCRFQEALEALHSVRTRYSWQPFIVDNWIVNRGVAGGWNEGCRQALEAWCTHILVINDDVVLSPWAVDALVDHLEQSPEVAVVSGVPVEGDRNALLQWPKPEAVEVTSARSYFCCFMFKTETLEHVGWFDEQFWPAYYEDYDYLHRVGLSGRLAQTTSAAPFLHYGSASQDAMPRWHQDPLEYYRRKWGGPPGTEQQHPFGDPGKTWRDV